MDIERTEVRMTAKWENSTKFLLGDTDASYIGEEILYTIEDEEKGLIETSNSSGSHQYINFTL